MAPVPGVHQPCQLLSPPGRGRVERLGTWQVSSRELSGVTSSRGHGAHRELFIIVAKWDILRPLSIISFYVFYGCCLLTLKGSENDRNLLSWPRSWAPRDSLGQLSDSRGHDRNLEIAQCLPSSNSDTRKRKLPLFDNYNSLSRRGRGEKKGCTSLVTNHPNNDI